MKGTYDQSSWEKQKVWNLDNGWTAIVGHSVHYGDFIQRLDSPDGKYWHCSNGVDNKNGETMKMMSGGTVGADTIPLPEFAQAWLDDKNLVRPNFEKEWK